MISQKYNIQDYKNMTRNELKSKLELLTRNDEYIRMLFESFIKTGDEIDFERLVKFLDTNKKYTESRVIAGECNHIDGEFKSVYSFSKLKSIISIIVDDCGYSIDRLELIADNWVDVSCAALKQNQLWYEVYKSIKDKIKAVLSNYKTTGTIPADIHQKLFMVQKNYKYDDFLPRKLELSSFIILNHLMPSDTLLEKQLKIYTKTINGNTVFMVKFSFEKGLL